MQSDGKHTCPGCRTKRVPDRVLCCPSCWVGLPSEVRSSVLATAGKHLLNRARRRALESAFEFWRSRDEAAHGGVEAGG